MSSRRNGRTLALLLAVTAATVWLSEAVALPRYNDGCNACHGAFNDGTSPRGSVFIGGDKHSMHRSNQGMNTACNLCHTSGDGNNPFIGSSDGTSNNPGLGCTGCHDALGLREHHFDSGIGLCYNAGCHVRTAAGTENTVPTYYGTPDTNVDDPCNAVAQQGTGENWTIGDFVGIDNDGDGLYDGADPDCSMTTSSPGEVPMLLVSAHDPAGGTMILDYQVGCGTTDNTLVWGPLSQVASLGYGGQACSIGNTGSTSWVYPAGSLFVLIAGNDGSTEGSYGRTAAGTERPEDTVCGIPQDLSNACAP